VDRDSVVGIATPYGLDGPGIEFRWGRDFPRQTKSVLGPTQSSVQWVPSLFRGLRGRLVALTTTPFSAEVKERVEVYLYSPCGPSWPVVGWNLLYFTLHRLNNFTIICKKKDTSQKMPSPFSVSNFHIWLLILVSILSTVNSFSWSLLCRYLGKTCILTLILLTWRIWWDPNNASRWQMGFNSAFKGLNFLK